MATSIGVNTITSIARRWIMPEVTDNVYGSNILLYRLMAMNKRQQQGGEHIEAPMMYARFNTGGAYRGAQTFNTTPSDTLKNAAWDWKQYYVSWSVDGLTLIKADGPDSIINFLTFQAAQAKMEMAEYLARGLFGDALGTAAGINASPSGAIEIDGLAGIVGTGSTIGNQNYGGLDRTLNTWWNSSVTGVSATQTMTMALLNSSFHSCTRGGNHVTLILSGQDQYNRFYNLNTGTAGYAVQYDRAPMGHDALLASAGFTNLLMNQTPWVVDSHVGQGVVDANNSRVYYLNENFLTWVVARRADFYLKPFQEPPNQDVMVASILWAGNLVCTNPSQQGGVFNFNA